MLRRTLPFVLVLALFSSSAFAAEFSLTPRIGTVGLGVDLGIGFTPQFAIRLGGAAGSVDRDMTQQEIDYTATADLQTFNGLLDWHPTGGGFRISAGAMVNDNRLDMETLETSTYVINGRSYSAAQVGTLTGDVTFNSTSPYLGIGFGNPSSSRRVSFSFDLGALYQGEPKVTLVPHPVSGVTLPQQFYDDLEKERQATEDDLSDYKIYPVVNFGLTFRF